MSEKLEFVNRPKAVLAVTDAWLMIRRSSTHILRNTDQLLGTFFQPIMFLVLFTAVYSGAVQTGDDSSYTNFIMAGLIIQTLAFGSTTTALAVSNDLQRGIIDRFRSLPMSSSAVLTGHVVSDVLRNVLSTVVLLVAGLAVGFRPEASLADWLVIGGFTVLLSLAFSWLAAILGIVAKSVEGVQWLSFIIVFPLTFASSAFVNPELMTSWLRTFAENQPLTHIIDTYRALLLGDPIPDTWWIALLWLVGAIIIAVPLSAILFRRKTS